MRLLLILIVIAAIFAVVQSQRHGCSWGQEGWFDCVLRGQIGERDADNRTGGARARNASARDAESLRAAAASFEPRPLQIC